ncbi:MAG: alpha-L-fucosidase [Prevotellaceae bacterium]|nr:alpha-L-fucosidase [Prevotellaceae bacterium]
MKTKLTVAALLCVSGVARGQLPLLTQEPDNPDNEPLAVHPLPTERQLLWNETEFYAFFHYGMNTYTGREWGKGDEAESAFAPTAAPNPRQWLEACKAAGMKGGIAVVKHHDGFCLWPTATTRHSVENAGNACGRETNIPRDFAEAARDLDMKYGFYVSPWDRNSASYGEDNYVTEVFLKQCAELAEYGSDQFEMWFDGANGGNGYYGGRNTTVSVDESIYYDIPNLRDSVHKVCPDCVMWGQGGEARWIGNESGYAGETNWAMVDRGSTTNAQLNMGKEDGWAWQPGESDAKITDAGWFWHEGENVKSAERLFQMYLETVGRNATLILNCPPDKSGLLPEETVNALKELGTLLTDRLGEQRNLAPKASIDVSETRTAGASRTYKAKNMTDGQASTYWATNDSTTSATITLRWKHEQTLRYVLMQEYIRLGQRVKDFSIEISTDGSHWTRMAPDIAQTTIGYKRIVPLCGHTRDSYGEGYRAKYLRINIRDSRGCPLLSNIGVY